MKVNGEAIYNSRPLSPYQSDNICFTQSKDGKTRYLFYMVKENDTLPSCVELPSTFTGKATKVNLLGYSGKIDIQKRKGIKIAIIPGSIRHKIASFPAW